MTTNAMTDGEAVTDGQIEVRGGLAPLAGSYGHFIVAVPDSALPNDLATPRPALLTSGRRRVSVLLHRSRDIEGGQAVEEDVVAVPSRLQHRLGLDTGAPIVLRTAYGVGLTVTPALADDLPVGACVHVAPEQLRRLRTQGSRGASALLIAEELQLPVTVKRRSATPTGKVRVSMLLRTLAGVENASEVALAPLRVSRDRHFMAASLRKRVVVRSSGNSSLNALTLPVGVLLLLLRCLDFLLEYALRPALLAPRVAVRTEQGQLGDDTGDVVRAHPALIASLGLPEHGGQAIMSWGHRRTAVLVVPDIADDVNVNEHLSRLRAVTVTEHVRSEQFPRHLLVRVSANARQILGMPPHTVVELRRRLRPLVLRQMNNLITPLLGLVLAAVAIEDLPRGAVVLAAAAVLFLGLAPLRLSRPGRGLWP